MNEVVAQIGKVERGPAEPGIVDDGMVIGEHTANGVTVLAPRDRLTVETFGALRNRASRLVDDGRLHVVLNLNDVPYVDSIGVAELVRIHLMLERCGGKLALSDLNRAATQLLTLTRLTDILHIFSTEVEAVRSYATPASG